MSTSSQNDIAAKPPEPDSTTQKMDQSSSESNQFNGPAMAVMKRTQPDNIDSNGEPDAKRSKINTSEPILNLAKEMEESTRNGEGNNKELTNSKNDSNCNEDSLHHNKAHHDVHDDLSSVSKTEQKIESNVKPIIQNNSMIKDNDEERTQMSENMSDSSNGVENDSRNDHVANVLDKENETDLDLKVKEDDEPMDTSEQKEGNDKQNPAKSDNLVVVVLSDDESKPTDTPSCTAKPSWSKLSITTSDLPKEELIRKLQEELRNEEAKLLLLKKLRQSQLQPIPAPKDHHALVNQQQQQQQQQQLPHIHQQLSNVAQSSRNPNAVPPPLVHNNPHQNAIKAHQQGVHMPQLLSGRTQIQHTRIQQGPPPLIISSSRGSLQVPQYQVRHQQMQQITSSSHSQLRQSQAYTSHHGQNSTQNMENQSPASRQAAAKLALRKQLEKTLLQIPPPKPPPPELHFLPSAANNEFIYLVGLEEVVNCILENNKSSKERAPSKFIQPFQCAQCKSYFTTIWKHDSKNGIMCESCIVSNQKKALKAEHTNRLKTAFVKALQQEQEIEQRMQNQNATNMQQAHSHHQRAQHRIMNPAPAAHRPVQPINYAYIPQMIQKPAQVDRQREYLLDMIPSKGLSQTVPSIIWK